MNTPQNLAGYQTLCREIIRSDDLVIPTYSIDHKDWRFADAVNGVGYMTDEHGYLTIYHTSSVIDQNGLGSGSCGSSIWRVYRRIPCPTHLDDKLLHEADQSSILGNRMPSPKAKTDDDGKPPLAYIPWKALDEIAQVQAYGHRKYHDYNNYRKGMEIGRNLSCAMRHIGKYMEGQDLDEESKRNHLAHAACRIMFVLQNLADGVAIDDRFKPTQP